eukprot:176436_1
MPQRSLLYALDTILVVELCTLVYAFLGLCAILIIVSKLYAIHIERDDIQYIYFMYFIGFSLNFFANTIIFTLRLFEQEFIVLGIASLLILTLNKFVYDITATIKSQEIWTKPTFISKRVKEWFLHNEIAFTVLSFIFGPIAAITLVNSRLFLSEILCMKIPNTMIVYFIGNMFWEVLLLQRLPEMILEIVYIYIHGYDQYVMFATITTSLTLILLLIMKLKVKKIKLNYKYFIHQTTFLMEISSEEIIKNVNKYLLKPNAFRCVIADTLKIKKKLIELPSFEAIKLDKDCDANNKKVTKIYGLKIHFTVNTIIMSRREILMKLKEADIDGSLVKKLIKYWNLNEEPCIDEIEMVYNLFGDLIIPRVQQQSRSYSVHHLTINLKPQKLILAVDNELSTTNEPINH